jgi:hypothetical protein
MLGKKVKGREEECVLVEEPVLIFYRPDISACVIVIKRFWHGARGKANYLIFISHPFLIFLPLAVAHRGTLWCILVHYGFKIYYKWGRPH